MPGLLDLDPLILFEICQYLRLYDTPAIYDTRPYSSRYAARPMYRDEVQSTKKATHYVLSLATLCKAFTYPAVLAQIDRMFLLYRKQMSLINDYLRRQPKYKIRTLVVRPVDHSISPANLTFLFLRTNGMIRNIIASSQIAIEALLPVLSTTDQLLRSFRNNLVNVQLERVPLTVCIATCTKLKTFAIRNGIAGSGQAAYCLSAPRPALHSLILLQSQISAEQLQAILRNASSLHTLHLRTVRSQRVPKSTERSETSATIACLESCPRLRELVWLEVEIGNYDNDVHVLHMLRACPNLEVWLCDYVLTQEALRHLPRSLRRLMVEAPESRPSLALGIVERLGKAQLNWLCLGSWQTAALGTNPKAAFALRDLCDELNVELFPDLIPRKSDKRKEEFRIPGERGSLLPYKLVAPRFRLVAQAESSIQIYTEIARRLDSAGGFAANDSDSNLGNI